MEPIQEIGPDKVFFRIFSYIVSSRVHNLSAYNRIALFVSAMYIMNGISWEHVAGIMKDTMPTAMLRFVCACQLACPQPDDQLYPQETKEGSSRLC